MYEKIIEAYDINLTETKISKLWLKYADNRDINLIIL